MPDINDMLKEQARQGEKIESIQNTCEKIENCLLGNGKPGLVIRTDRLEQRDAFKSKWFWVFTAAIITLLVKTVGSDVISIFTK